MKGGVESQVLRSQMTVLASLGCRLVLKLTQQQTVVVEIASYLIRIYYKHYRNIFEKFSFVPKDHSIASVMPQ